MLSYLCRVYSILNNSEYKHSITITYFSENKSTFWLLLSIMVLIRISLSITKLRINLSELFNFTLKRRIQAWFFIKWNVRIGSNWRSRSTSLMVLISYGRSVSQVCEADGRCRCFWPPFPRWLATVFNIPKLSALIGNTHNKMGKLV